jgi:uncharacterized protein YraI
MNLGKKLVTAAAATAFLVLGAGSALASPAYATGSVNVRTGPSVGYHRVDTLHRGESVNVTQCQRGWCYVRHNGPDGWVSANYLSQGRTPTVRPRANVTIQFGTPGFSFSFGNPPPRSYYPHHRRYWPHHAYRPGPWRW